MPESGSLEPRLIPQSEHRLRPSSISKGARQVLDQLAERGFVADLVGGCVRDLLLGRIPKDFDVVSDATPEEIRQIFPRSRIVGRRFRIVHVRVGREIIEVSTYRAAVDEYADDERKKFSEHGQILRDNTFGTRDQDVLRRDFTINALYYDPRTGVVTDYVNGFADVKAGRLRFIGDGPRRVDEDPVRMLRVARFKAKLDLKIDPGLVRLCTERAFLLRHVPPARLFDETLKLFHSGHALAAFNELRSLGLFAELFPEADRTFEECDLDPESGLVLSALANTDKRLTAGKPVIAAFLFAVFLWRAVYRRVFDKAANKLPSLMQLQAAGSQVLALELQRVAIPRRVSTVVLDIWEMQLRLEARRPRTVSRVLEHKRFRAGYDILVLRANAGELPQSLADWWTEIQEVNGDRQRSMVEALGPEKSPGKRRRRPRKRGARPSRS